MFCPNCGKEIEDDSLFCSNCGSKIAETEPKSETSPTATNCPNCGKKVIEEGDAFCPECGYRLQETPAPQTQTEEGIPVLDLNSGSGETEIVCPMCKCKIPASSKFCPICSQPVKKTAEQPRAQAAASAPAGQTGSKLNIFSLIGFICSLAFGILTPMASSALGLVFGILGMKKSKSEYGGSGKGLALAAIIISAVILFVFLIVYMTLMGEGGYYQEPDGHYYYY